MNNLLRLVQKSHLIKLILEKPQEPETDDWDLGTRQCQLQEDCESCQ